MCDKCFKLVLCAEEKTEEKNWITDGKRSDFLIFFSEINNNNSNE